MKFCSNIRAFNNKNKVILSNPDNGSWIRLNEDVYSIIKQCIDQKNESIIEKYQEEDRKYIYGVIGRCQKIGIVDYNSKNTVLSRVDFSITDRCNLKCKHCLNSEIKNSINEPSFEKILLVLNSLQSVGVDELCLTGGEPLIRDDFFEIINIANEMFKRVSLLTNGTYINSKNVKKLSEKLYSINISVDGYDDSSCEKIRGVGVFNKVVNSIQLLKDNGFDKISLSTVQNKYTDIEKFLALSEKMSVIPVIRKYAPSGRGYENANELFEPILKKEILNKQNYAKYISGNRINYSYGENSTTVCSAFEESVYIGSDLNIYPCGALNLPEFAGDNIGDIKNLNWYFTNKQYKKTLAYKLYNSIKPENAEYCKNCSVCIFCNDCPAYLYLYNKYDFLNQYCSGCKESLEKSFYG